MGKGKKNKNNTLMYGGIFIVFIIIISGFIVWTSPTDEVKLTGDVSGTLTSVAEVMNKDGIIIETLEETGNIFDIYSDDENELIGNIRIGLLWELDGDNIDWNTLNIEGRLYRTKYSDNEGADVKPQPITAALINTASVGEMWFAELPVSEIMPDWAQCKIDGVDKTWDTKLIQHEFILEITGVYSFSVYDVNGNIYTEAFDQVITLDLIWKNGEANTDDLTEFGEPDDDFAMVEHTDFIVMVGESFTINWDIVYNPNDVIPSYYEVWVRGNRALMLDWNGEDIVYTSFADAKFVGDNEIQCIAYFTNGDYVTDTVTVTFYYDIDMADVPNPTMDPIEKTEPWVPEVDPMPIEIIDIKDVDTRLLNELDIRPPKKISRDLSIEDASGIIMLVIGSGKYGT